MYTDLDMDVTNIQCLVLIEKNVVSTFDNIYQLSLEIYEHSHLQTLPT